jgi:RHS repeat-associated protein
VAGSASTSSGSANYDIPISVPPGTNGVAPALTVSYSSMAGNGQMGMGWGVSGMSMISRKGNSPHYDVNAGDKALTTHVDFSSNDKFQLDGQRLIAKTGSGGFVGNTFGTEVEDFTTITAKGDPVYPAYITWFEVKTKDGVVMEYGNGLSTRKMAANPNNNHVLFWYLSRVRYPDGNYIEYKYLNDNDEFRLDEINYTGNTITGQLPYNKVKFSYVLRADVNRTFFAGTTLASRYLVDKISTSTEGVFTKQYAFTYAKSTRADQSLLIEVTEKGSDGVALNSTIFKYFNNGDVSSDYLTNLSSGSNVSWQSLDINGDGRKDMVKFTKASSGFPNGFTVFYKNLSDVQNFSQGPTTTFSINSSFAFLGWSTLGRFFSDFDGDGTEDIMLPNININDQLIGVMRYQNIAASEPGVEVNISGGTFYNNYLPQNRQIGIRQGDFNGDGRTDILGILRSNLANNSTTQAQVRILFGGTSDWVTVHGSIDDWILADQITILDVNGDGKDDIVKTRDIYTDVFTVNAIPGWGPTTTKLFSTQQIRKDQLQFPGDFNGDGLADILIRWSKTNNNSSWSVMASTGTGFLEFPLPNFWSASGVPNIDQYNNDDILIIGDFDLNGKSDIHFRNNSGTAYSYWAVGDGIFKMQNLGPFHTYFGTAANSILLGDVSGDGVLEVLHSLQAAKVKLGTMNSSPNRGYIMQWVKDGFGNIHAWDYKRLTDATAPYVRGAIAPYPVNNLQIPLLVVSEMRTPNPTGQVNTTTYQYEQMQVHRTKGMLGFRKATENNLAFNLSTTTITEVSPVRFVPYLKQVETKLISTSAVQSRATNTFQFTGLASSVSGSINTRVYQTLTSSLQESLFENRTATTTNTYDNFGNITAATTNINNGLETTSTATIYGAYVTTIPNRPTSVTVTNTRAGETAYSVTNTSDYDALGRVNKTVAFAGIGMTKAVTSTYGYNQLGNQNTMSVAATGLTTRTTTTTFDVKGRFPISSVNAIGQVSSSTYDPKWGKALTSTSIDQLTTTYTYDAFGRQASITPPTGVSAKSTIAYAWDASVNNGTFWGGPIYIITETLAGKPDVKTTYNGFGQVKKVQQQDFISGGWITSTTDYSARGTVSSSTAPYKSTETPFVTTSEYWDFPIRLKKSTNSFGSTQYGYTYAANGQLTTTVTNPAGYSTSSTTDAAGKMVSSTDPGGTLTYAYYSNGQTRQVSLGASVLVRNEYDVYGRQIKLDDANAGITAYQYDAFGQLKTQTTALGHTTTMTYDVLGRVTQRVGVEGTTTTNYFTTGIGQIGRTQNIAGFSGDITAYTYDQYGRLKDETITFDGFVNKKDYAYNTYGDLVSTTYPGGFIVQNEYNTDGYLTAIKNGTTSLFTPTAKNGLGQYTGFMLGNSKTSTVTYNQGIPTRYLTAGLQDLNFTWNYQTGNLTNRNDAIKAKTESFTYSNDALNRLMSSSGAGLQTVSMTYSPNGNIATKSDVGTLSYSPTRFNAVTSITSTQNIPVSTQNITYTPFLQPAQITEGSNTLIYTYGADQQRVRSVVNGGTSKRYYFGDYEINVSGGVNTIVYYVPLGSNTLAIATKVGTAAPTIQYAYTDYLGSILTVTNSTGAVITEQNFDAWGRMRNPSTWAYTGIPTNPTWLYRGYTGHEHVTQFGLINMNGRMYDPVVGRMLSVDNYTHGGSQGYNRYSYVLNNPLRYTDPSGEWLHIAAGAVVGGIFNVVYNYRPGDLKHNLASFGIGAFAGALGAATGGAAVGVGATGALAGMVSGATGGAVGGIFLQTGNTFIGNQDGFDIKQYGLGILTGGIIGGAVGGAFAHYKGLNWWTGAEKNSPASSSFNPRTGNQSPISKSSNAGTTTIEKGFGDVIDDQGNRVSSSIEGRVASFTADELASQGLTPTNALKPTHFIDKSQKEFTKLFESIQRNGITEPVKFVEHNGVKYIVDGHHRYYAGIKLGYQVIPTQQVTLPYMGYQTADDLFLISGKHPGWWNYFKF